MSRRYLKNFDCRQLVTVETEYLVIGGGIAGLFTAWSAYQKGAKVTVITKQAITDSNTNQAQGGIAAAIGKEDSPEIHAHDTVIAGGGLCNESAVDILVTEGVARIEDLMKLGVDFDENREGIALGREGCHSQARILHANGDATGAEIIRGLGQKIAEASDIEVIENQCLVDLLVADGVCYGALVLDELSQQLRIFNSRAVVLATGGIGQLYEHTTNPEVATADGIGAAWRAGADIMDMEFVQFHPTVLALPGAPSFLISEAVRGEGAILKNIDGKPFMYKYHAMAELAPRDVVTNAIFAEMTSKGSHHVLLDITHLDPQQIKERFPMITATCLAYGLDITKQLVPVAPAAHYMMGGVKVNVWGETSIGNLFCCGEASCVGVHGANRLASNSLLEGLVMGERIAKRFMSCCVSMGKDKRSFGCNTLKTRLSYNYGELRNKVKKTMEQKVGPQRTGQGLKEALMLFGQWDYLAQYEADNVMEIETRNMLTVGRLIAEAAALRTESRGGHFRQDYPEPLVGWCKHMLQKNSDCIERVAFLMNDKLIYKLIEQCLYEDMGSGDITTNSVVPVGASVKGVIHTKQSGIIAGLAVAEAVFRFLSPDISVIHKVKDGDNVAAGTIISEVEGDARTILTGERVALNFLQRMSGIATYTSYLVEMVKGYPVRVVDTRKTTPGLRMLEKYAVLAGGGYNHRFGLYDAILLKDNHIKVAGGITQAIVAARQAASHMMKIEVEVEDLAGVAEALQAKADVIMLDNMDIATMTQAVTMINHSALVEASGGISEESIVAIAKTGVDIISVGALTHSVQSLDISLDIGCIKAEKQYIK